MLTPRQQSTLLEAVERRLADSPAIETRNRKPMRPNPVAPWELRIGSLRVYYDVEEDAGVVSVRAVGIKERNRVSIGGVAITL